MNMTTPRTYATIPLAPMPSGDDDAERERRDTGVRYGIHHNQPSQTRVSYSPFNAQFLDAEGVSQWRKENIQFRYGILGCTSIRYYKLVTEPSQARKTVFKRLTKLLTYAKIILQVKKTAYEVVEAHDIDLSTAKEPC